MNVTDQKVIIIGGGFYGLSTALFLRDELNMSNILVIEKESMMMTHASYVNQARVHNGYHYPRSILTASRSAANFPRFVNDYKEAIIDNFDKYYATSRILSKVNSNQFINFAHKINVKLEKADEDIYQLFNTKLVENVFKVQEYAFNSHTLRDLLMKKISQRPGIILHNSEEVKKIAQTKGGVRVETLKREYVSESVINTSYTQMNLLHRRSNIPLLPLKHEATEMALVRLPKHLEGFSITVMDGPFFSIMPFPSKGLYTLSHVRYTPHSSWFDDMATPDYQLNPHQYLVDNQLITNYKKMYADVIRYIPALKDMEYVESITEVKTVLQKSENDDSRPILFKPHFAIKGYACIMGGKLDNIYDVFEELEGFYEKDSKQ